MAQSTRPCLSSFRCSTDCYCHLRQLTVLRIGDKTSCASLNLCMYCKITQWLNLKYGNGLFLLSFRVCVCFSCGGANNIQIHMWKSELIGSTVPNFPVWCQYPLYPHVLSSCFVGLALKPILLPENSKHNVSTA